MSAPELPEGRVDVPASIDNGGVMPTLGRIDLDPATLRNATPVEVPAEAPSFATGLEAPTGKGPRWLLWGGGLVLGLSAAELLAGLWHQWQLSPLWGGLWSLACLLLGMGAARTLWAELRSLRQLKSNHHARSEAQQWLTEQAPAEEATAFCQRLAKDAGWDTRPEYQQWLAAQTSYVSAQEQISLFAQTVLTGADEEARKRILRWSSENAIWVAISPFAAFDILFVLWRNLRMVEQIARCYGVRLGYWSRVRLLRQVFRHLVYLGAAELVSDIGLDWVGAELTARLSAKVGQGLGAGLLTVRLGMAAMTQCRPLPFDATQKPRLSQFRRALLDAVMARLTRRQAAEQAVVPMDGNETTSVTNPSRGTDAASTGRSDLS